MGSVAGTMTEEGRKGGRVRLGKGALRIWAWISSAVAFALPFGALSAAMAQMATSGLGAVLPGNAVWLQGAWPAIRQSVLDGSYRPSAVRRVSIPKPVPASTTLRSCSTSGLRRSTVRSSAATISRMRILEP